MLFAGFNGIALYNWLVMAILIPLGFKKRSGWYFWSLTISCWGVASHSVGCISLFFSHKIPLGASAAFMVLGWVMMVSGQAVVLWSRLNLLDLDRKKYMPWLYVVLCWSIALHVPTAIFQVLSISDHWRDWLIEFTIMDKIQTVGFCIQEFIISAFWIYRVLPLIKKKKTLAAQLVIINSIIILTDAGVVAVNLNPNCSYALGVSLKSMVYSIKVMLEFAVLGNLKRASAYRSTAARSPSSGGHAKRRQSDTSGVRSFFNLFGLVENPLMKRRSNSSQVTAVDEETAYPVQNIAIPTARVGDQGTSNEQSDNTSYPNIKCPIRFGLWDSRFNEEIQNETTILNNLAAFIQLNRRPKIDPLDPHNLTQVTPKASMSSLRSRVLCRSPKIMSARSSLHESSPSTDASVASISRPSSPRPNKSLSLHRVTENGTGHHGTRSPSPGLEPIAGPSFIRPRVKA